MKSVFFFSVIYSILAPQNCEKIFFQQVLVFKFSSVLFSRSVVSHCLQPHESQHTRPPCPSPTPGVYSNSCPSSWWCHPAISSSIVSFSSSPQSLPASGSFPMSQLFAWDGQSIGVSALTSVLPVNTQNWCFWTVVLEKTLESLGLQGDPTSPS